MDADMNCKAAAQFDPSSYGRWRQSRLGRITDTLERNLILALVGPVTGRKILDVGCGDGDLILALAQAGAHVTGIDADPRILEAARLRFEAAGAEVRLARADAEVLPFENASFDVATAVTVLCFAQEPDRAISEMARVLKPGGLLVIGELSRYSLWAFWRRLRGWLGHPTWRSAHFRSAAELRELATGAGLAFQTTKAAVFYPPLGWAAALLAPADRWLGRHLVCGGAFLVVVATKPIKELRDTGHDRRRAAAHPPRFNSVKAEILPQPGATNRRVVQQQSDSI
jgi:SAM-dependent methyltransferase